MPSDTATITPEFLDLRGLAVILSASPKGIQRLLASGRLPAADVNISVTNGPKGRRWRRDHVLDFLAAGRREGGA